MNKELGKKLYKEDLFLSNEYKKCDIDYKDLSPSKLLELKDNHIYLTTTTGYFEIIYDNNWGFMLKETSTEIITPFNTLYHTALFLGLPINILEIELNELKSQTFTLDNIIRCNHKVKTNSGEIIKAVMIIYTDWSKGRTSVRYQVNLYTNDMFIGGVINSELNGSSVTIETHNNPKYLKNAISIVNDFMKEINYDNLDNLCNNNTL